MGEYPPILTTFIRNGGVVAVWRDENGKRVVRRVAPDCVSTFAIDSEDVQRIAAQNRNTKLLVGLSKKNGWVRFDWNINSWDRQKLTKVLEYFEKQNIELMEADLRADLRWMVDNDIKIARPRACYLDIETDSRVSFADAERLARILCVAVVDERGNAESFVLEADTDAAERKLLVDVFRHLEGFDQVRAWNGEAFDFKMLRARCKRYGLNIDFDFWLWVDPMVIFKRMNSQVAESGDEKQSYALDAVAKSLLKMGKLEGISGAYTWDYWQKGGEARDRLIAYCVQDTDLMRLIEEKTGYIATMQTLAEVCGIRPDTDALHPTKQVQGFVLRVGEEKGFHFPTKLFGSSDVVEEQFEGAAVMAPQETGIIRDVHVADFSGMYPSIVRSWNMSVETCCADASGADVDEAIGWDLHETPLQVAAARVQGDKSIPDGMCCAPLTGVFFRNEPDGLIAHAMSELVRMRKSWNDKKSECAPGSDEWRDADRRSNAYKVAANSFYGVLGNRYSRFYRREVAESVSTTGKWLILQTIEEAKRHGCIVIYSDTDSIFVRGKTSEEFAAFVEHCNRELYPRLLKEQGCTRNFIKLDYQESFSRIVFTSAKRYAACFSIYKGKPVKPNSQIEVKGLEYKRGDGVKIARVLQAQIIEIIVREGAEKAEDLEKVIEEHRAMIRDGELPLEMVRTVVSLSKNVEEYAANTPAKRIAEILKARGRDVRAGTKIGFVTKNGRVSPKEVIPEEDYNGELDRVYLWEHQVYPPTQRFLEAAFPSIDWTRFEKLNAVKPSGQTQLLFMNDAGEKGNEAQSSVRKSRSAGSRKAAGESTATSAASRRKANKSGRI